MVLSKDQAKVQALMGQVRHFLAALADARGRLEVIDHVTRELLADKVSARALDPMIENMGVGLDQAGNAADQAMTRLTHVLEAMKS